MAADMGCRLEVDGVLSFADDLVGMLRRSDDANVNAQVIAGARMLRTACRSESDHLELHAAGRATHNDLEKLDHQRASIEERKDAIEKKDEDMRNAMSKLSMCVSVTNIIPDLEDQNKISGCIVDKNGKRIQKFEIEKTTSPV